ncbi:MAG: efflux RND transporter permease subunit [Candidatus Cryptobacteroides sp.]
MKRFRGIAGMVKWAIAQKHIVYTLVSALCLVGIVGLVKMKKDEFPSFTIKQGVVVGVYPGATAEEVENHMTKQLEDVLFSVPEISRDDLRSVSKDGMCYIYADLTCKVSQKNEVWTRIKQKINEQKPFLPTGVLAVMVLDDFNSLSSMMIALESEDKGYPELQEYADRLCTALRRIPDLAKVEILGEQQEEIAIILDREKISAYGIDPSMLTISWQGESIPIPGGTFDSALATTPIHVYGNIGAENEIAEKIVYADHSGNIIRLRDIATITRRYAEPDDFVSYNGHACLILSVEMRPNNNIVAFGKEVDDVLEPFAASLPESVTVSRITDQPKIVNDSIFSFLHDLLLSMIVVILVMLTLFPLKSAIIAGSGVPVCTAITIAIMYICGMDLNTVTLAALIVVLGMIVDNSIITMDGYMDKLNSGMRRVEAACSSIKELFAPTFAATLAISAMLFPIKYLITGYLGDFVRLFPWVIAIAMFVSLIYAVSVVPSLEVKYISSGTPEGKSLVARMQMKFFSWLEKGYAVAERFCFRHPVITISTGVLAVALGFFLFSRLNIQMMPKAARDFFAIELEVEGGHGIDRTKEVSDSLQRMLLRDERVTSVTSFVGTGAPRFTATYAPVTPDKTIAQLIVNTGSSKETESMIKEYENRYEHLFPDVSIRYKQMDYQDVEAPIVITLKGEDRNELICAADSIRKYMSGMDTQLKWVHSSADNIQPSVMITLDDEEASRLGVNKAMLAMTMSAIYNGQNLATVWEEDEAIGVNLYTEGVDADMDYDAIGSQMISTAIPCVSVPLRQVASIQPQWSSRQLERRSGEETVSIFADMKYGKSQPRAMKQITKYIDRNIRPMLPEGAVIEYGGLTKTNEKLGPEIGWSLTAAVLILLLFMIFHFKKVSLSILTLVMSLLCLFGAFLGLWMFNLDFGLTAVLGIVSLIGIIVRNGIVMFEYAEELRFVKGLDVKTAAMEAGARRMKPIFLTSCTTALGVIPMVIGGDLLWQPMGVVICFGIVFSILLIVLIMPVSYWVVFRNQKIPQSIDEDNAGTVKPTVAAQNGKE